MSVVQEKRVSELKWVECSPKFSISDAVVSGIGDTQEWESALCAIELVFLNILQIAHASCRYNDENNNLASGLADKNTRKTEEF